MTNTVCVFFMHKGGTFKIYLHVSPFTSAVIHICILKQNTALQYKPVLHDIQGALTKPFICITNSNYNLVFNDYETAYNLTYPTTGCNVAIHMQMVFLARQQHLVLYGIYIFLMYLVVTTDVQNSNQSDIKLDVTS